MGFWLFMLVMNLLIPVAMIFLGRRFLRKPPKEINSLYGYRTTRSMRDQQCWDFAQNYCGRLWQKTGVVLLPVSGILMLLLWGEEIHTVSLWGALVASAQVVILCLTIIPVERALKRNFDK